MPEEPLYDLHDDNFGDLLFRFNEVQPSGPKIELPDDMVKEIMEASSHLLSDEIEITTFAESADIDKHVSEEESFVQPDNVAGKISHI